jgi:prolyl oligopeptidase
MHSFKQISAVGVTLVSFMVAQASFAQLPAVSTAREPVTNSYHGVSVVEDYQWLEASTNPVVRDWTRQQNERTRAYFDKLAFHAGLSQALEELISEESASYALAYKRGENIFALRNKPPAQQPVLVRLKSVFPPALRKVVFDPNAWNTNGTTAMDWFVPSPDGRIVAISLSEKGSEDGTLHFFETETGRHLPDTIPGVQYPTGGGSAAWNSDGTGILYIRDPANARKPTSISSSKSGFTNWARRRAQTHSRSGASSRASRRLNWRRARMVNGFWPRSPTVTAAISTIICATPPASGGNSHNSTTA